MPTFVYNALNPAGQATTGELTAETRTAALEQVSRRGLFPVSVQAKEGQVAVPTRKPSLHAGRVPASQVEAFTRELANLLAAGVPLSRALSILRRETRNSTARLQWSDIYDEVVGGKPLADALARFPRTFAPVYVAMVRAGETGGFLDMVLGQIADFRARESELKGKVKAALVYPCVLAVLAVAVMIFLLAFFIPRFSGIFQEFGARLPALTRGILTVSGWVTHYGVVMAVLLLVGVVAARRAAQSHAGKRFLERAWLRLPGIGVVTARFALVRFARMLGTLLGAGVPLVTALRVAKEAIGNQTLADAVDTGIDQVKRGSSLAKALAGTPRLFPPSVVEMVAVAEESSRLDQELLRLAKAYELDLDRQLRMLVALAEPALLFCMAALIGTVVIGMLLPVFTLQELIK